MKNPVMLLSLLAVAIAGCSDSQNAPEASSPAASASVAAPVMQDTPVIAPAKPVDDVIMNTGTLTGSVTAPVPFQAAQIYAMNSDSNILYMVYTQDGRFEAVNMIPGNYDVSVRKFGLAAPTQSVNIQPGASIALEFSLTEGTPPPEQEDLFGTAGTEFVAYEELFPPGDGHDDVEGTCLSCHNATFFGQQSMPGVYWDGVVDRMIARGHIRAGTFDDREKSDIAAYLTANFGLDSIPRAVPADFPLDEEALGKAQYVEYYLPLDPVLDANNTNRRAQEVDIDQFGNIWFTERTVPNRIGKLDPRTGKVTDYPLPDTSADPHGLNIDRFGKIWWAETDGFHLGRLDPETGDMTRFNMNHGDETIVGRGHTPYLDSKDNVWFSTRDFVLDGVESEFDGIGVWSRTTGEITLYMEPTADSRPYGLLVDVNDIIWTGLSRGCGVASFNPATEEWTEYFSPSQVAGEAPCNVRRLGVDSTGSTVWFGIYSMGKMGKIDVATGEMTEYDIPMFSSQPYDTWPDPNDDSKVWVTDGGQGGTIILFSPETADFTYYPTPQFSDYPKIRVAGDGTVWYPARAARKAALGALYPDKHKMTSLAAQPYRYR